ncbi:hypothetical protein HDU80_010762 [Chytriomyces hyalinus]|nr:hypothetical protein HDU80_010762 [Chytriomyces hyalinus]
MGEPYTGKSCLIKRYCEGRFVPEYISTIGIDYGVKTILMGEDEEIEIKVNFWDVAGDPVYFEIRNEFYKDTHGAILLYDTTSRKSFESLEKWVEELMAYYTQEVTIFLVANKVDSSPRMISTKEGMNYAEKMDFAYFETSALTGEGVAEMFTALFQKVLATIHLSLTALGGSLGPRIPRLFTPMPVATPTCSAFPSLVNYSQARGKTFRKKVSKPQRRYFRYVDGLKAQGLPVPKTPVNVIENKFWKVSNGMKVYKPVSPGSRNRRHATRFHLHKGSCIRRLSHGKRSTGGRNNSGRITMRHKGGGHKRRVRSVDFMRTSMAGQQVVRMEYDPNRSASLCLLRCLSTNEFSYIVQCEGVQVGSILHSYRQGIPSPREGEDPIPRSQLVQQGNCLRLRDIPVGTLIHCISLRPDGPAQICRSAGTSAQLIATDIETGHAQIRLASKEVRIVSVDCVATIGVVGNKDHRLRNWGKAGARRRKGIRPSVRGIHMNPCDHPHGGGSNSKGNKHNRTPWGWLTKGWKTVRRKRWFIVTPRWKANKK